MVLLDKVFGPLSVDRAWVNVPDDNSAALGLFEKLGFVQEASRELCKRPDGSALNAHIMAMDSGFFRSHKHAALPVVSISGLPGSGSEAIGEQVAQMIGSRMVDHEVAERLCGRLGCSPGELEAFEGRSRSFWSRLLNSVVVPMEWSSGYDAGYHWFRPDARLEHDVLENQITKKKYLDALTSVFKGLAVDGNVVLHHHSSHLFVPSSVRSLSVFVSASPDFRQQRIAKTNGMSLEQAAVRQKTLDENLLTVVNKLFDYDMLDMERYDIALNVDRVSIETAAHIIVGALKIAGPSIKPRVEAGLASSTASL